MSSQKGPTSWRLTSEPVVRQLVAMLVAAVLVTAVAVLAVSVTGGLPPRLTLTGPTWQWTGSTAGAGPATLVVPDPAAYTIDFARDRTFAAGADCNRVAGTYDSVPAGRAGGATNSLLIVPGPTTLAACGPDSLAGAFVEQLGSAARYAIDGSELTITLAPGGEMTFRADVPLGIPSPGS